MKRELNIYLIYYNLYDIYKPGIMIMFNDFLVRFFALADYEVI